MYVNSRLPSHDIAEERDPRLKHLQIPIKIDIVGDLQGYAANFQTSRRVIQSTPSHHPLVRLAACAIVGLPNYGRISVGRGVLLGRVKVEVRHWVCPFSIGEACWTG